MLWVYVSRLLHQLRAGGEGGGCGAKQTSPAGPMMIGCSEGGTSIEDLAEKYPEKIIKIPVDIREGITDAQANEMVDGLQVTTGKKAAAEQIKNLYNMYTSCDCTMVEVRPPAIDTSLLLTHAEIIMFSHLILVLSMHEQVS